MVQSPSTADKAFHSAVTVEDFSNDGSETVPLLSLSEVKSKNASPTMSGIGISEVNEHVPLMVDQPRSADSKNVPSAYLVDVDHETVSSAQSGIDNPIYGEQEPLMTGALKTAKFDSALIPLETVGRLTNESVLNTPIPSQTPGALPLMGFQ